MDISGILSPGLKLERTAKPTHRMGLEPEGPGLVEK
jgi:hypothetical protein